MKKVSRVCGNKARTSDEQCDDGNTHNGDGCSSTCQTEAGFICIGSLSALSTCAPPPTPLIGFLASDAAASHVLTEGEAVDLTVIRNGDPQMLNMVSKVRVRLIYY